MLINMTRSKWLEILLLIEYVINQSWYDNLNQMNNPTKQKTKQYCIRTTKQNNTPLK
jgi:hypothetical protein